VISLNNGRTFHAPANLDPIELERLWGALFEKLDPLSCKLAHSDPRWRQGDRVKFLEIYFEHARPGHKLTVG